MAGTRARPRRLFAFAAAFLYLMSGIPASVAVIPAAPSGDSAFHADPTQVAQDATSPPIPNSISVGFEISGLAYDPVNNELFVGADGLSEGAGGAVILVNGVSNTVVGRVKLANIGPLAVVPSQGILYVGDGAGSFMGGMFVINTSSDQVFAHVSNLETAVHFAVDTKNGKVYTATTGTDILETTFEGRNFTQRAIQVAKSTTGSYFEIAVNPSTGTVYAVRADDNFLYAVNPSTGAVTTITLNVPQPQNYPPLVVVDSANNKIFVAMEGNYSLGPPTTVVEVVDGSTDKLLPTTIQIQATIDDRAVQFVASSSKNLLYLTHAENLTSVINGSSDALVGTERLPDRAASIVIDTATDGVYVANAATKSLSEWDPTITKRLPIETQTVQTVSGSNQVCCRLGNGLVSMLNPQGIIFDSRNDRAYMADADSNVVEVLDPSLRSVVANVSVSNPAWLAVLPSSHLVFASDGIYSRDTYVIDTDTNSVVAHFNNIARIEGMAADDRTGKVYMVVNEVGAANAQLIEVSYDGSSFSQRFIAVDSYPRISSPSIAVNPATGMVYVVGADFPLGLVYAVNPSTGSVVKVSLGILPSAVAVNPQTDLVYLAGQDSRMTTLLTMSGSSDRVLSQYVSISSEFSGQLLFDGVKNVIFVFHHGDSFSPDPIRFSDHVTAVNSSTQAVTGTVGLPDAPVSAAVDTETGDLFVGVNGNVEKGVVTVATSPTKLPGNVISRPLLSARDLFPPAIQAGGHFGVFYDRVELANLGTVDGSFLLSTFFIPGITYSTNLVTPFRGIELVHFEQGAIVYSVTLPALSSAWVDIPVRVDPSVVNFAVGSLGQGKLFSPGSVFQMGLTIQLATLSPTEWNQINSHYRDTGAIDQAMFRSFADEAAFESAVYPPMPALCLSTVTSGCQDEGSVNATYQVAFDRLWATYQVAPALANYIAFKISDRNLRQAISQDSNLALPDPPSGSGAPSWGELVSHASPELKSHIFSCIFQEMMKGWLQELLADPINDATYGLLDLHLQGNDRFVTWGRWIAVGDEVAEGGISVLGPKIYSALSQTEAANKIRDVANSAVDYASTQVASRLQSAGWGFDEVLSKGESVVQVSDNHVDWAVGKLNVPEFPNINTESTWAGDWPFFSWPSADNFVNNAVQLPDISGGLSPDGFTEPAFADPTFKVPSLSQAADALSAARDEVNNALNSALNAPFDEDCSQLVGGMDPNEMFAFPSGYIRVGTVAARPTALRFGINFENLPNATGPAINIRVVTTVDPSLNLSRFNSLGVSHPYNLVNITVDQGNRQITWYFENITLPPDKSPPEGDGWVKYTIDANVGLQSGTTIKSQAGVYFDYNPPVTTNVVEQIVDNDPPVTSLASLPSSTSNTVFDVGWSGTDAVSGVANTLVLVSKDNMSNFHALNATGPDTAHFIGQPGHTYYFVALSVDNAGNFEVKSRADAVVTIQSGLDPLLLVLPSVAAVGVISLLLYARKRHKAGRQTPKEMVGRATKVGRRAPIQAYHRRSPCIM